MKDFKWKPLLLVLSFLILLGVFAFVDEPLDSSSTFVADHNTEAEQTSSQNKRESTDDNESSTSEAVLPKRKIPKDAKTLHLAIGKVGSLEHGGGDIIYEEPDDTSEQLAQLQYNCAVIATEDQPEIVSGWVQVEVDGDGSEIGYVKKSSATLMDLQVGDNDSTRDEIVKSTLKYIGLPFKRYGDSLETGLDCSNFVMKIYDLCGYTLPDRPLEQYEAGTEISLKDALPGDIVFYDKANDGSGHVGIYLGDGMIINSSGHSGKTYPEGGVRIVCLQYPDRISYKIVSFLSDNGGSIKDISSDEDTSIDDEITSNTDENEASDTETAGGASDE